MLDPLISLGRNHVDERRKVRVDEATDSAWRAILKQCVAPEPETTQDPARCRVLCGRACCSDDYFVAPTATLVTLGFAASSAFGT